MREHLAALALALVFLAQVYTGSLDESLTWDEPGYIAAGYANWVWGDYRLNADHPPLMQKLQGLPLLFMDVSAPLPGEPRYLDSDNPRATYGRDLVFHRGNDVAAITRWGRAPSMLLGFALVLCVYGFGRELFGGRPALVATALAALCPNLVAHAKLATEDMGCTALMFGAVWTCWRGLAEPRPGRAAVCGVVTGLALLSKYTALLLGPVYALLAALAWRRAERPPPRAFLAHFAGVAGLAFVVVGLGYGAAFRPDRYLAGVFQVYPDVAEHYSFYFWGRVSEEPFWYHALASLLFKLPVPTLLLVALAGVVAARREARGHAPWLLLVAPLVVLLAACFDLTSPGLRRVLPAVPFLLLFAGGAAARAPSRLRRGAVAALLVWLALEAALIFPHHLSYLNAAVGGPERGPYIFDESNIDWGQDLPALAAWQREHLQGERLHLLYFGSAAPAAYGVRATELDLDRLADPPPGTYAISAHYLGFLRKLAHQSGADVDWLGRFEPVAKAGYSIFIYRFPPD